MHYTTFPGYQVLFESTWAELATAPNYLQADILRSIIDTAYQVANVPDAYSVIVYDDECDRFGVRMLMSKYQEYKQNAAR